MVSLKTHGDRTLFFDFLPFDMGQIKGFVQAKKLGSQPSPRKKQNSQYAPRAVMPSRSTSTSLNASPTAAT